MADDVEIVRRLAESFAARDAESAFDHFAEDIEWDARAIEVPDLNQVYRGHDGVRAFWRGWFEAWDQLDFQADDPVTREDGRISVLIKQRNHARGVGIWVEQRPYHMIWTLEDGKVTRLEFEWAEEDDAGRRAG